jgi:hypothetical protein
MISIEVDGGDYALQTILQGIMQALQGREKIIVRIDENGITTSDTPIKDEIMERYREIMDILMEPDTAVEAAVTAVARERGMDVIRIRAPAKAVWILYK